MADLNIMPLFTDAYLADTTHLTREEHGSYLLMLMAMWRAGGKLPNDHDLLRRIAKCTPKTWPKTWEQLERLFTIPGDGTITQKKLSSEHTRVMRRVQNARENGKSGGRPKSLKDNGPSNPTGSVSVSPGKPDQKLSVIRNPESEKKEKGASPSAPPAAKRKTERRSAMLPLPIDWKLPEEWREAAREKGLVDAGIDREAKKFANHARMKDRRCANWKPAWENWVVKAIEFDPGLARNQNGSEPTPAELQRAWFIKLDRAWREGQHDRVLFDLEAKRCPQEILEIWREKQGPLFAERRA